MQLFNQKQCSVFVSITGLMLRTCNNLDINNGKNQDKIFCVISAQSIKKWHKLFNLRKCLLLVSIRNVYFLVKLCFLSLNNSNYDPLFCHYTSQNTLNLKERSTKILKTLKYIYIYIYILYIIYLSIYLSIYLYTHTYITVHHVAKCMSCHKAIVMITGKAHCFHDYI